MTKWSLMVSFLVFTAIFAISQQLFAVDIRGRIDGINKHTRSMYPLSRIRVELHVKRENKWVLVAGYTTGYDGMYYFKNVTPGTYTIQVNRRQNYPVIVRDQLFQDIPSIVLKY